LAATPTLDTNRQKGDSNIKVPRYGGTLNLVSNNPAKNLDPHNNSDIGFSSWGAGIIYQRLMKFESGSTLIEPSLNVECDLCEDWEMISPTEFQFNIKTDRNWNSNNIAYNVPLTANDIKFSLERIMHQSMESTPLKIIKNINLNSMNSLTIELDHPNSDFLLELASVKNKIISNKIILNDSVIEKTNSIGSNSWSLKTYLPDTKVTVENIKSTLHPPYLDQIDFNIIPDHKTRLSAFKVGLTDVYEINNLQNNESSQGTMVAPKLMVKEPGNGLEITFNTTRSPYDDLPTRLAIMAAINPKYISDKIWDSQSFFSLGFPVVTNEWLPKYSLWQDYFNQPKIVSDYHQKRFKDTSFKIQITTSNYGALHNSTLNELIRQLNENEFETETIVLSHKEYMQKVWENNDYDVSFGPIFPVHTPNSYMVPILHSKGDLNTTKHVNINLDKLIESQSYEYENIKRTELIQNINKMILDNGYRFMITTNISSWTWQNKIENIWPNFYSHEYSHWDKVWIND
jgi:ABC-type transport system substrate-binding protein